MEHDDRPLTPPCLKRWPRDFPLDWQEIEEDAATRRFAALREAAADPLFPGPLPAEQLARIAEQQPAFADQFIALHAAYRRPGSGWRSWMKRFEPTMPAAACRGKKCATGSTMKRAIMSTCSMKPPSAWDKLARAR
jgi:hypothetical protein